MREIALHLLDIVENSISAQAKMIIIRVEEDHTADRLHISIEDDGRGMDAEMVAKVADPFVTSRTTRKVGLGIPLLKAAAEACEGGLDIQSELGKGTCVTVTFKLSHIDRMPLGHLASTLLILLVGTPEVHWLFHYRVDDQIFSFDDQPVKETLEGIPLSDPLVLGYLRELLQDGIAGLNGTA